MFVSGDLMFLISQTLTVLSSDPETTLSDPRNDAEFTRLRKKGRNVKIYLSKKERKKKEFKIHSSKKERNQDSLVKERN